MARPAVVRLLLRPGRPLTLLARVLAAKRTGEAASVPHSKLVCQAPRPRSLVSADSLPLSNPCAPVHNQL